MAHRQHPRSGVEFLDRAFGPMADGGACRCLGGAVGTQPAKRRLEIAFRVNQEIGGDDNRFTILHAFNDFNITVAACAEPDLARFEAAFAGLHEDDLPRAAVNHGGKRHGHDLAARAHRKFHLGEHCRLEPQAGVSEFDADRHRARLGVERRIDVGDSSVKYRIRIGVDAHPGVRTGFEESDILLEDVGDDPHRRQIGDLIQGFARHETHALQGLLFGNDTGDRRAEGQCTFCLARARQCLDLRFGDIPVFQARQTRFG